MAKNPPKSSTPRHVNQMNVWIHNETHRRLKLLIAPGRTTFDQIISHLLPHAGKRGK